MEIFTSVIVLLVIGLLARTVVQQRQRDGEDQYQDPNRTQT